jgi:diguanylate cyclase (GGDEF)-like protein
VLQDSYRMAFHDELTGLPGRRALNERLMGLDDHYAIAMIDVDHFKLFNDSWGHEVGDQVLKLVASRLQRVGGGGRAYRYGGEEFTIVFAGLRLSEWPAAPDKVVDAADAALYRAKNGGRNRVAH